jgi:predicted transposase/invertase (TIGR01784 family)
MTAILPPKSDEVFKMLFGDEQNKEILAAFLKAVLPLPDDDYEEIEILNPFLPGEVLNDKIGILDLKLRLKSGRLIDVEIVRREVAQVIVPPEKYPGRDLMFRHQ